jgi:integrase
MKFNTMSFQRVNYNFYLKRGKANKKGELSIVLRFTFNSQRVIIFINEVIHPKYWSSKNQRVKSPRIYETDNNHEKINFTIDRFESKAKEAIRHAYNNNIGLTKEYFKNYFSSNQNENEMLTFFAAFDRFINISKAEKQEGTIKGYNTVLNYLKTFQKDTDYYIDFNTINQNFYDALQEYSFISREPSIQQNYFAKIITVLKTFLNWCKVRGIYNGSQHTRFKATETSKEIIYLEPEEFKRLLYNYKLNKKYEKARDVFCFACLTGLRYSDLSRLRKEHFQNDHLVLIEQKNDKSLKIPVIPPAKQIIDRYDYLPDKLIPRISSQRLNQYIKEACRLSDITAPVVIRHYYGNRKEESVHPKHELITIHAARKTFITLSFIYGMNTKTVKSITGHKKDSTFDKYLKITDKYKQEQMLEAWSKL